MRLRLRSWADGLYAFLLNRAAAGFVLGFLTSLATSFAFHAITGEGLSLLIASLAIVALVICLHLTLIHTRWLAELVAERFGSEESDARDAVITDVLRSLIRYGVLRSRSEIERAEAICGRFIYLRGQRFLGLLRESFLIAERELRILNDHPFAPFSEAVVPALGSAASIEAINAIPDSDYDESLLANRVQLAAAENVTYWLLPKEDIHLSLILFDRKIALVYATPRGRLACDFSETLVTDDSELIELLGQTYDVVRELAERKQGGRSSIEILESARRVAASGRAEGVFSQTPAGS
jgi:hypothetical protein